MIWVYVFWGFAIGFSLAAIFLTTKTWDRARRLIAVKLELERVTAERDAMVAALGWIALQPCIMEAEGASEDTDCSETSACITEWCLPCYAREHMKSCETSGEAAKEG